MTQTQRKVLCGAQVALLISGIIALAAPVSSNGVQSANIFQYSGLVLLDVAKAMLIIGLILSVASVVVSALTLSSRVHGAVGILNGVNIVVYMMAFGCVLSENDGSTAGLAAGFVFQIISCILSLTLCICACVLRKTAREEPKPAAQPAYV